MNRNKIVSTIGNGIFPFCIVQTFMTVVVLNLIAIPTWYNNLEIYQTMPDLAFMYVDFTVNYGLFLVMAFMLVLIFLFFSKRGSQKLSEVAEK